MFVGMDRKLTKFKAHSVSGVVDRENNIIKGMTLIQANREALGHELFIDEKFVRQVVKQGKATGEIGLKARFDHPSSCFSSMGSQIGRFKNFKMKGDKAVADLHLGDFAFESNPNGNLGAFLMDVAENDPEIMGNSIVFTQGESVAFHAGEDDDADDPEFMFEHARLESLHGCDVVDQGAATDGMFSIMGRPDYMAEQVLKFSEEHPEILKDIIGPLVEKYNESKEDNINQNQNQMSDDNKLDAEFAVTPDASADEVVETPQVNVEFEDLKSLSDAQEIALTELNETNTSLSMANEELAGQLKSATDSIEAIKADFEAFKNESIGNITEPVANTEEAIDSNDDTNKEQAQINKDEQIANWANEELAGNSASKTHINSSK